jgi:methionyl-tRNA formyltransferase
MRVVFMGTSDFAVPILDKLVQSEHQIAAVYTQPDRPAGRRRIPTSSAVKKAALAYGLSILQPEGLKAPAEVERLARLVPDVIVVAAFGQILPLRVLEIPPFGCLNIHPSLLPRHRGISPIPAVILDGDDETGVTIMLMDAGVDTGPILVQEKIPIEFQDTAQSLSTKLARLGAELLARILPLWLTHKLTPQPQDESKATYTRSITKSDGEINWQLPAIELWRRVRAFYPWPGCYTWWRGKLLKLLEVIPLPGEGGLETGRVMSLAPEERAIVGVGTGKGILGLHRVQLEGRRAMEIQDFLLGRKEFIGALLPDKLIH